MTAQTHRARRKSQATRDEVIAALQAAEVALINASEALARRYGAESRVATQSAGAARMIATDWIPNILKEEPDAQ
jgi:hypothetical protein